MPLDRFGYTHTQDTVLKALLRRGSATGYAIARDTGLARANVYQALDALVSGGLASSHGKRPVTYTALPAPEVLERLAAQHEREVDELATELGSPPPGRRARSASRSGSERLDGQAALGAAAVAAVDAAEHEVLAVVGPWAAGTLHALRRARQRQVATRVVALGSPPPEGAILRQVSEDELVGYWGGLPVALVCDRAHAVCGVMAGGSTSGVETRSAGLVPFLRHLLRRELASAAGPRPS